MNALIYLRVSTKEQAAKGDSDEGYSIPAQREACLRHCAEKGWNVSDEFVDAGESARSADRPNLKAMLARIAEGDIGAVVVHKIDRLARNIEDHVAIRAGLRKAGVQLVSVTENIEESASGKLVEGIHALMAEFYSANLATEVRKGMTQKAKQGLWPAKAPIGYLNVRKQGSGKRGTARVVLDPERALLVREAFRMYATGDYSLAELHAALQAKGLTSPTARKPGAPLPVSALATMLQNPFYIGVVEWDGVQYPGKHKSLISKTSSRASKKCWPRTTRPACASAATTTTSRASFTAVSAATACRSRSPRVNTSTSTASVRRTRCVTRPTAHSPTSWRATRSRASRISIASSSSPRIGSSG
jgi:site-specific DNA recombinase